MISTARISLGVAVVSTGFLSGSFRHVGAQFAGEAATTSEPCDAGAFERQPED
jgi:hypothetical protein